MSDAAVQKTWLELLTGNQDQPQIHFDNKRIVKLASKVQQAYKSWKWDHRNDTTLNADLRKIRKEFEGEVQNV